jgi:hypothetical protein
MSEPKWNTPEWHRLHPIYFTVEEMKKPMPELIEGIRNELANLRGKLFDLSRVGWSDRFTAPEGGMTLVIQSLYLVKEEIEKAEKRWAAEKAEKGSEERK